MTEDVILFSKLRGVGNQALERWIERKMAEAVKVLAAADGPVLHRAQGRYGLLEEMRNLLHTAKNV